MGTLDDEIISHHNSRRRDAHLSEFIKNQALTRAAATHAYRMYFQIGLSHDGWEGEIRGEGFSWNPIGQNIAIGCYASTCTRDWFNSPPHRANILNGAFTRIGVGNYGNCWAVNFGGLQ